MTFDNLIADRVRPLAETLIREGLHAVRIVESELEIELVRSVAGAASSRKEPSGELAAAASSRSESYDIITSDVVGRVRFLRPAVVVGTRADGDRELAFIEALGIRNPIRSRGAGRVAVVFVEEGQAVDYGAPLFAIDRTSA